MNNSSLFTAVLLDKVRRIRFSNRAVQRVGQLENALALDDISNRKRSQAALLQWLWGCLIDEDAAAFKSPEDLADALPFLTSERKIELMNALSEAIALAKPKTEKNADSSTPSPLPASS